MHSGLGSWVPSGNASGATVVEGAALISPLEFTQRLAALVPRPRLHLIGFHGLLAPTPGYVPTSFRTCRSIIIPPKPTTPRCPSRSACLPELGQVAQTGCSRSTWNTAPIAAAP
jgi:hypothetical protein